MSSSDWLLKLLRLPQFQGLQRPATPGAPLFPQRKRQALSSQHFCRGIGELPPNRCELTDQYFEVNGHFGLVTSTSLHSPPDSNTKRGPPLLKRISEPLHCSLQICANMNRDDKLSLGQLSGLSDTTKTKSQDVPPRARLTCTSSWKVVGCSRAESLFLTKGKPSTSSTCRPWQHLGIVSLEHPGTWRKRRGQEEGGTDEKSEEPDEPPKRVKKEHGEMKLGCPKPGHDDMPHHLEQGPFQQNTQHCDKGPQKEDVTEVKLVGSGKGRNRSYGKMEENVKNDHGVKCRKLDHFQHGDYELTDPLQHSDDVHTDHLQHSDLVHTGHLQHSDLVHTGPLQHSDLVHTGPLQHGDYELTDPLQHSDDVHTDHLQHSDLVHTGHLQHSDLVHTGPLQHSDLVHTGPLQHSEHVNTGHLQHRDLVHTGHLQHRDLVHTGHLQHSDLVHTGHLQHSDHVHTAHLQHSDHVHTGHLQHRDLVHTDHLQHHDNVYTGHLQYRYYVHTDHLQHSDLVHTGLLQHSDHVHTGPLQHRDHVHTGPLQHRDHVHTGPLQHRDHVHTGPLQYRYYVHTDPLQHRDHVHTGHLQYSDQVRTGPLRTDRLADPLKIKGCMEENICEGQTILFQPNQSSSPVTKHHSPVTDEQGYSPESHCEMQKRVRKNLENERWRHHPYSDALGGAQIETCKNTVTRGIANITRLMPKAKGKPLEEQEMGRGQDQFPEVTADMENEIARALGPGPQDEILSSSFKLNISRGDMQTLRKGQWLNDEIINFYMSLLMERSTSPGFPALHIFSTFFYTKLKGGGHRAVKRWTQTVNIFEKDIVLVPVHLDIHWTLVVVDLRKKTIVYWDPMGEKRPDILAMIFQYLQDESKARRDIDLNPVEWKQHNMTAEEMPLQLNQSDCGMFTCKYADYISRDQPVTFSQKHMPLFRKQMVWEILHKCLL